MLGLGNTLMGDDGLGVRALERLGASYSIGGGARLIDGGTLGLALLPYLDGCSKLLLLDAVASSGRPGALVRLSGDQIPPAYRVRASMHESGLPELLAAAELTEVLPESVLLLGIEPAQTRWGDGLSPAVAEKLDDLVAAAAAELQSWGCAIEESREPVTSILQEE